MAPFHAQLEKDKKQQKSSKIFRIILKKLKKNFKTQHIESGKQSKVENIDRRGSSWKFMTYIAMRVL